MTHHRLAPTQNRVGRWWWIASAMLTVAGVVCVFVWIGQPEGTARAVGAESVPPPVAASTPSSPPPPTTNRSDSRPVRIHIPAAGVSAEVGRLGLQPDGTVEVPSNPDRTGWFRLGPPPGDLGSAVILGHVDSKSGPAVFAELKTLRRGHRLTVEKADGTTATFEVTSIRTYPNELFPAKKVYGRTTGRWLSLVTCGGAYDPTRGGYQSNVVVLARWVKPSPTT